MTTTTCGVCQAATDGFACKGCIGRLERQLAELPSLLHELTVTETRQGRVYRAGGRPERDAEASSDPEAHVRADLRSRDGRIALRPSALPFDENASVLRDETWATCAAWGKHLAESKGIDGPSNASLLVWLASNAESIRWDEAAAEMVDEIDDVHRRLTRAIDSSPSRTFWGRCDAETVEPVEVDGVITVEAGECGRDLYAKPDAGTIVCDGHRGDGHGCGATRATEDVRASLRELTEDALVTIDEVQFASRQLFGEEKRLPSAACWRTWANRGQIKAHGKNRQGEPLYRGADIIEKIETFVPRSGRRSA